MTPQLQERIIEIINAARADLQKLNLPDHVELDTKEGHPPISLEWHTCPACSPALFDKTDKMIVLMFMGMVTDPNPMQYFARMYLETIAMTLYYSKKTEGIDELYKLFSRESPR